VPSTADAAGEVRVAQVREQRREDDGAALQVGVQRREHRPARRAEPRHECGRLPARPWQADRPEARLARGERGQERPRRVGAAVVDHEQLPGEPGRVERRTDVGDEPGHVPGLVARRHDDA
jgi:hypothetical protein